jgi:hypothetical protein
VWAFPVGSHWRIPSAPERPEQTGQATVTIAAALAWSQQPDAQPGSTVWSRRMTAVRGFARYLAGIDPATEVPPLGLLPHPEPAGTGSATW